MSPTNRPNILFIMCDQLRHEWLGYAGAGHVRTPNIDRIAAGGKVFTQCCTNSPVCAPARIGLATGIRPHRDGALNNHAFLPLSRTTYYHRLRDRGYYVGCCGKLDLAKPDGYNGLRGDRPWTYAWGFTDPHECEGKMHAGRGDPPNGPYTAWLQEQGLLKQFTADARDRAGKGAVGVLRENPLPAHAFEDVYIGRKSCEMLRAMPTDFPWHFFVSFVGPHDPFDPPAEYAEPFRDAEMPPAIPCEPDGRPHRYHYRHGLASDEQVRRGRQLYTGYMACIDEQVGRILETLEERGEADNTYVVFAADHGEMLGDHGRWTKSCHYESALRVPLAVAGPGIEPGRSDALVELSDLNPTLCELAGVEPAEGLDARPLTPLLRGETSTHREFTMATLLGGSCVRTAEWKLIVGAEGRDELYHLAEDPQERRNVIDEQPDVVRELRETYKRTWMGGPLY
jgi:choline-sulfatase